MDLIIGLFMVFVGLVGGFSCAEYYKDKRDDQFQKSCLVEHGGKPYTVEKLYAKTSAGCTVTTVAPCDATCGCNSEIYVTNCAGVGWNEQQGKYQIHRSNGTAPQ